MKANFSLGPSPVSCSWCCAALKEEMSRSMEVPFLFSCQGAPLSPQSSVCPLLYGLALSSSSRKPALILRLTPTLPFSESGCFMSSVPPCLGLIALSNLHASCLCHRGSQRKAMHERMSRVYASCVSPPQGRGGAASPGVHQGSPCCWHTVLPKVPVGAARLDWVHEVSRTAQSLLNLWSLLLVHFISGSGVSWEGYGLPLVFHWM